MVLENCNNLLVYRFSLFSELLPVDKLSSLSFLKIENGSKRPFLSQQVRFTYIYTDYYTKLSHLTLALSSFKAYQFP